MSLALFSLLALAADGTSAGPALMSPPTPLVLDAGIASTVSRIGVFDHPANPSALHFQQSPTPLAVPNSFTDSDDEGSLFAQDMWGIGIQRSATCDELKDNTKILGTLIAAPVSVLVENLGEEDPEDISATIDQLIAAPAATVCDEMPHTLSALREQLQAACGNYESCAAGGNPGACAAENNACHTYLDGPVGSDAFQPTCDAVCPHLAFDASSCAQVAQHCSESSLIQCYTAQAVCSELSGQPIRFAMDEITLGDVFTDNAATPTVQFNGETVSPYAQGFPVGFADLQDAAVLRRNDQDVGMIALVHTALPDLMQSASVDAKDGVLTLSQVPGFTPQLIHYRMDSVNGARVLMPSSMSTGLVEPPLSNGTFASCFPMITEGPDSGNMMTPEDLQAQGCAGEAEPVRVLTASLFGSASQDLVVVNRGELPSGAKGFVTIYRDQGANVTSTLFAEQFRYEKFLAIGAEPYGAAVISDTVDGVQQQSILIAAASATPSINVYPHTVSLWKIVNSNDQAEVLEIPVGTIVDDSDLADAVPYDVIPADYNGDGIGDFVVTWVQHLYDDKQVRFAPFFHLYLGQGEHKYSLIARYDAPAKAEDGLVLSEAGGMITNAGVQLATGAPCDLDRDGLLDLCLGDQHPRVIDGKVRVSVDYYRNLGGAVFDTMLVQQFQTNTREDFLPDLSTGWGGVKQVVVDEYDNIFVAMGAPEIFPLEDPEVPAPVDLCPQNPTTDPDHDGIVHGLGNMCPEDNCPTVSNPDQFDSDGDGVGDACEPVVVPCEDADGDGLTFGPHAECNQDNCPNHANPGQEDQNGDGQGDACDWVCRDDDEDGVWEGPLSWMGAPFNPLGAANGFIECPLEDNCDPAEDLHQCDGLGCKNADQADSDGDGIGDLCDNCPDIANPSQSNVCGPSRLFCADGMLVNSAWLVPGQDPDGDGIPAFHPEFAADGTLVPNGKPQICDNCPEISNVDQSLNADNDVWGDACDLCPNQPASDQNPHGDVLDFDNDQVGDACDADPADPNVQ